MPLAAARSARAARPTKPVATAWAKNVPTLSSTRPSRTADKDGNNSSGSPRAASASAPKLVLRVPQRNPTGPRAALCEDYLDSGTDSAPFMRGFSPPPTLHHAQREGLLHQHEVHVGECADKGEEDAKADSEGSA